MSHKADILVLCDFFLPGHRAGGPIRTIANLVENLGDSLNFHVITRDRDWLQVDPYPDVHIDNWNPLGKARVYYASPGPDYALRLTNLWRDVDPDVVYLNSFFSPKFTILPLILRRLGAVPKTPTIVAPRGEFHRGALDIKSTKKQVYRRVADLVGLYDDVAWCATNEGEANFIRQRIAAKSPIKIAPNLGAIKEASRDPARRPKESGRARFVVIARVSPIKNHHRSLEWLAHLDGDVTFDIYGPIGQKDYWSKCQRIMKKLPQNIDANYLGPLPHDKVHDTLGDYDFFLMPSTSENHGHAIVEAMMAGCPPIISQGTPWRNLQELGVGWDIDLADDQGFVTALQRCVDMSCDEYAEFSQATHEFGKKKVCSTRALELNRQLFEVA